MLHLLHYQLKKRNTVNVNYLWQHKDQIQCSYHIRNIDLPDKFPKLEVTTPQNINFGRKNQL